MGSRPNVLVGRVRDPPVEDSVIEPGDGKSPNGDRARPRSWTSTDGFFGVLDDFSDGVDSLDTSRLVRSRRISRGTRERNVWPEGQIGAVGEDAWRPTHRVIFMITYLHVSR